MITYRKIQIVGENHPCNGLWYARPVINETLDIELLSRHMSKHNTPFSPGVIKGVLADMVTCIKELILDGKNVKLDDLAIFSVGIISDHGAASAAECGRVQGVGTRGRTEAARTCHRRTEQRENQPGGDAARTERVLPGRRHRGDSYPRRRR